MQGRKLFVTYEAIYDIVDAEEHIIRNFGTNRKERFVIKEDGVHVLRVPREEYDWGNFFLTHEDYEYSYPDIKFI